MGLRKRSETILRGADPTSCFFPPSVCKNGPLTLTTTKTLHCCSYNKGRSNERLVWREQWKENKGKKLREERKGRKGKGGKDEKEKMKIEEEGEEKTKAMAFTGDRFHFNRY